MPIRHEFATEAAFEEALRNWFAGQALGGFVAAPSLIHEANSKDDNAASVIAAWSYQFADAMLAEREKAGEL
jgi:hypothetical protein